MTDLQLLYRAKSTLEGYWGDEHYNQNCNQKAIEIKNAAKKDIAAKCKTTFTAVRKRSDKIVFADGGWIILFFLAAIVALVIAAPFTFAKPIMNFSLEDYVAECAEEVREGTTIAGLYWGDDYNEIVEKENAGGDFLGGILGSITDNNQLEKNRDFIQDCATFLFGNLIFTFLLCALVGFVFMTLVKMNGDEYEKAIGITLAVLSFISIVSIIFVYYPTFEKAFGYFNQTEMWFSGIFQTILGIPLLFVTSGKIVLPIILIHTVIYAAIWVYTFVLRKNRDYFMNTREDPEIRKMLDNLDAYVKQRQDKANADASTALAKRKRNAYATEYSRLDKALKNLDHVKKLIWAIENRFACDIVSANNYLDRKAYEAQVNKRLSQIESTSAEALAAAQRAEASAEAARKAAEAPVEVHYYYY